jgi:hypothetical protein
MEIEMDLRAEIFQILILIAKTAILYRQLKIMMKIRAGCMDFL